VVGFYHLARARRPAGRAAAPGAARTEPSSSSPPPDGRCADDERWREQRAPPIQRTASLPPPKSPPSTEPPYDEVVPGRRPQPPLYTRPCRGLCLARPLWSDASQTVQMRRSANPSEIIRPTRPRRACQTPAKAHRWSAVMTPKDGGLRADDVAASHRAVDGDGPSIRDARTYAHGTSRGAVAAVSCVWPTIRPILKSPNCF
jgi:hypothetical protein